MSQPAPNPEGMLERFRLKLKAPLECSEPPYWAGLTDCHNPQWAPLFPPPWVRAAVLIPIVNAAHPSIVFIQRAQGLRHHAGQIAFPGGRVDETDLSPEDAACREAFEEIGLERDAIEVLGLMQECVVRSGFRITPVLSFIQKPAQWVIDPREVARVFEVPLWDLLDARRYKPRLREWVGHRIECIEYEINNELIWGATAGMLAQCLQLMRTCIDR